MYRTIAITIASLILSLNSHAEYVGHTLRTDLVPGSAEITVLLPPSYKETNKVYTVLFWLHGGGGDNGFLKRTGPIFESGWKDGSVPEMIVVTPNANRSFYLDYKSGKEKWESLITKEILPYIRKNYRATKDTKRTFIGGISMGGMGSLRMATKYPNLFGGVIALEPGIEPNLAWKDVEVRDKFWRAKPILEERFGRPFDEAFWAANNPATIVNNNPQQILDSDLKIYLEAGSEDGYGLDRGTEFLHRILYDHNIHHEYRYVYGADHVGATMNGRIKDALLFLNKIINPPGPDPQVTRFRNLINRQKARAGVEE
jgi:S-formylglutathione hydrolase